MTTDQFVVTKIKFLLDVPDQRSQLGVLAPPGVRDGIFGGARRTFFLNDLHLIIGRNLALQPVKNFFLS